MRRILLAGFLVLNMGTAFAAGRTAPPPPSGVVVHLFGPQGVWSDIFPTSPAPPGAPPQTATAPAGAAPASSAGPLTAQATTPTYTQASASTPDAASAAPSAAYPEPTLGAILHQMFVTGDPTRGPGFSRGRQQTN